MDSDYDYATKMQSTRATQAAAGLVSISPMVAKAHKDWWRGQMDIATAAALESAMARDPNVIQALADIRPKERPKLSEAVDLLDRVSDELKGLAEEHKSAVQAQSREKRDGADAKEAREYAHMMKCYAMEYVAYIRARGYRHLIRYYQNGGTAPRILDGV